MWNEPPRIGEVWKRRKDGKTETRTVIDRFLGGDVYYRSGKRSSINPPVRDTLTGWREWQREATKQS